MRNAKSRDVPRNGAEGVVPRRKNEVRVRMDFLDAGEARRDFTTSVVVVEPVDLGEILALYHSSKARQVVCSTLMGVGRQWVYYFQN